MKQYAYFYICAGLLAGLWVAQEVFEDWSDARSRTRYVPLQRPLDELPFSIGHWLGRSVDLETEIVRVAQADQFIRRNYYDTQGSCVALYITYYAGLYRVIPHGPGTCYPMGGWKTLETEAVADDRADPACYLFLFEKELDRQAVMYWYYVNGARLAGRSRTRLRFAAGILSGSGGSIVQVQLATDAADGKERAAEVLSNFRNALEPVLAEFLPAPQAESLPHKNRSR